MITKIIYEQQGVSDQEAEVISLLFNDYDEVAEGDIIAEIETSKTTIEILASSKGLIKNSVELNSTIQAGDIIAIIGDSAEEIDGEKDKEVELDISEKIEKTISAKALKIAKSNNLTEDDLKKLNITSVEELNEHIKSDMPDNSLSLNRDFFAQYTEQSSPKNKLSEIESLKLAQSKTLPCTCSILIEDFCIEAFSKKHNLYFNNIFPVLASICSDELMKYRNLNGFFHDNKKHIYEEVNIGFTLDADEYLQVPVVHNCEKLNSEELKNTFIELLTASITGKMTISMMSKPTFVISDLSSVGDCFFHTPLLAPYTSAILGIAIDKNTSRLSLTLTYDHQMSSGKEALLFLESIRTKLSI